MSQPNSPASAESQVQANLQLQGGAAIVAPVSAFPSGVPGNALIVLPLSQPTAELSVAMQSGPVALQMEQFWKLLGFNGPAVQVQDAQGRPIAIGLEDLLGGLEKHWQENTDDLDRARIYAQELMKYSRFPAAEKVLAKLVASGGGGEDWLALGIAQLNQQNWEKAEGTLRGAQNLLPENAYPSLHLAKVYKGRGESQRERECIEHAIQVDAYSVDAWAYLFNFEKELGGEEKAVAAVEQLAMAEPNKKSAAAYIALQGLFSAQEETRDRAVGFAEKAVERGPDDALALISLSALYGQKGQLDKVVELLQKHEGKMSRDVRLANNYFEALFQTRQIEKVTRLLNALMGSPSREVKQFAMERSRLVAQFLQQQQQQLVAQA